MNLSVWALFIGALLVTMVLASTLLGRLPLSSAMIYLALGWLLGPDVANVLQPDPWVYTDMLGLLTEVALLISLFSVGMQLGVPLGDPRWRLPVKLAFVSMGLFVAMVTAVGVWLLHLPWGAAVLLGAVLAPTDPVLASGVHSEPGPRPDRLGFSLAGEGGLNDGAAYPFVMLGLALLGLGDHPHSWGRWLWLDLMWPTLAGIALGGALGVLTGRLVVYLRSRHGEAGQLNEFLGLGLVGIAYGTAVLCLASGFLAVFTAGLALQRIRERPSVTAMGHAHHASDMRDSVLSFNEQLEKFAELALVMVVGAMLAYAKPMPVALWFIPLLMVVLRPLSVLAALSGERLTLPQRAMISWFGIRGIGSVFYLLFAMRQHIPGDVSQMLLSLTLWTVASSIVAHGVTAAPLMRRYLGWRARRR